MNADRKGVKTASCKRMGITTCFRESKEFSDRKEGKNINKKFWGNVEK
jgi:hypothetical protein